MPVETDGPPDVTTTGAGKGLGALVRRLREWNRNRRTRARRLAVLLRAERRRGQDENGRYGGSARYGDNLP